MLLKSYITTSTTIVLLLLLKSIHASYLTWRQDAPDTRFKVVCYMTNWAQYRPNATKFTPSNIEPHLCTHLIYAFAAINTTTYEIRPYEWNDESSPENKLGRFEEFNNLKKNNPLLKTLLAVGGWNMGAKPFSDMAINETNRQMFIRSSVVYLRKWNFDGLDLDWEYPAKREGSRVEDRQSLTYLVKELREAFYFEALASRKEQLLLTIAVGAEKQTVLNGYDMSAIVADVDFVNVMSYDFHGSWDAKTGHNSPLYSRMKRDDDVLTVDWSIRLFMTLGVPLDKLIMGIPYYGRTFTLQNSLQTHIGANTTGNGLAGNYTREAGFMAYGFEVCNIAKNWTRKWSFEHMAPYIHQTDQWIGYDDEESIRIKLDYIIRHCLGGAMIWSLDLDDFNNFCSNTTKYPLTSLIAKKLQIRKNQTNCFKLDKVNDPDVKKILNTNTIEEIEPLNELNITEPLKSTTRILPNDSQTTIKLANMKALFEGLQKALARNQSFHGAGNSGGILISIKNTSGHLGEVKKAQIEQLINYYKANKTTTTTSTTTTVMTTKPDMTLLCQNLVDGDMIGDPFDCTSFYTCSLGKMSMKRKCNNNLRFDSKLKLCNWPDQVPCMVDGENGKKE